MLESTGSHGTGVEQRVPEMSYNTQQEQVTSKETNLSTIRFCRALLETRRYHLLWSACPYLIPFYLIVMDRVRFVKKTLGGRQLGATSAEVARRRGGGGGCPPPHWGRCPLPIKFFDLSSENSEFQCILGSILSQFSSPFYSKNQCFLAYRTFFNILHYKMACFGRL